MGVELLSIWTEESEVELPAIKRLKWLGYTYVEPEVLMEERESLKEVILVKRLREAIKRINPWIDDVNLDKAVRRLTHVSAVGLMEGNRDVYEMLTSHISLEQDLGTGKKGQTVKFIDYENIDNNEFIVTRQYKVQGVKETIIPDIVVFINGLPIGVIECKAESRPNAMEEGIKQLLKYTNMRKPEENEGAEKLFYTNQVLVSTFGGGAKFGTVGAGYDHYLEWKDPYPLSIKDLGKHKIQDILLAGIFKKENILDLIQNFIVYESVNGKLIKKLARYQQFRAVNRTLERLINAKNSKERSGVIWHTQGSGKSLTMVYLCGKIRRIPEVKASTILIITDRVDLDEQITNTFRKTSGDEVIHIGSRRQLRELLTKDKSVVIMSTIHKFLGVDEDVEYPVLSESENIIVMVDEAHRTQYSDLARNMRTALPNAAYLGFTGTPISKIDKNTRRTFGDYIDKYPFNAAIKDGATVPILYEGRKPELMVEGANLEELFDRVFYNKTPEEKAEIKKRYVNATYIAESPSRIKAICLDLIKHFEERVKPNGYKAMVVASSRLAAVRYLETLRELNGPEAEIIISGQQNDEADIAKYVYDKDKQKDIINRFKNDKDNLSILVVNNMLLTGFDAPVVQVMYLDRSLKEHNLLQAIARVNRKYKDKQAGIIVDYFGVSKHLHQALEIFSDEDIEGALKPVSDILPYLDNAGREAVKYFRNVDRNDLEECIYVLKDKNIRDEFNAAFKEFARYYDILMPDPLVNKYKADFKFLSLVYAAAKNRYRDDFMNLEGCGEKVRKLIEEHIRSSGISTVIKPISIIDKGFDAHVKGLTSKKAQASEIEHAIRHYISVNIDKDPVYYKTLLERLEEIIRKYDESWEQLAMELEKLRDDIKTGHRDEAEDKGLSEVEYAFYGLLKKFERDEVFEDMVAEKGEEYGDVTVYRAKEVVKKVKKCAVVDWTKRDDAQKDMKKELKGLLRSFGYSLREANEITAEIVELAKVHFGR